MPMLSSPYLEKKVTQERRSWIMPGITLSVESKGPLSVNNLRCTYWVFVFSSDFFLTIGWAKWDLSSYMVIQFLF